MENGTREKLVTVACQEAALPYHGFIEGKDSNLEPIIALFPKWDIHSADGAWCSAFVYFCLIKAGFEIPYSPDECITCSLAGCGGFEEFAMGDRRIEYHRAGDGFRAEAGDVVIFDDLFVGKEHDHIGIIIGCDNGDLLVAEGNIPGTNTSGTVKRRIDRHIRCFIRFPDHYRYGCYEKMQPANISTS